MIKKRFWKLFFNPYKIVNYLLLILFYVIADVFPFKNIGDAIKSFCLTMIILIMNELAIVEDKEINE